VAVVHRQLQTKAEVFTSAQWQQVRLCHRWSFSDRERVLLNCGDDPLQAVLQRQKLG